MTAPESRAADLVNEQAEDDGLWFNAQTAPEAYLQQALRELHAAVENDSLALTTSAAAEAAMREALAEVHRCDKNYNVLDCPTGGYTRKKIDAALATPASAQAEQMIRFIHTVGQSDCICGEGGHIAACAEKPECQVCKEYAALRALGETGET